MHIESRFSNDYSEPALSEQLFDSKIWRKDSKNSSKKLDKNNLSNANNFNINNNIDNLSTI